MSSKPAREPAPTRDAPDVQRRAAEGIAGAGSPLPHAESIQKAFGAHDLTGARAQVGGRAKDACQGIGAAAYASGGSVAFGSAPDLHTAAHEAAHLIQQRKGVALTGGVGAIGDRYERQADEVADAVVRGDNAEGLLGAVAPAGASSGGGGRAIQMKPDPTAAPPATKDGAQDARLDAIEGKLGALETGQAKSKAEVAGLRGTVAAQSEVIGAQQQQIDDLSRENGEQSKELERQRAADQARDIMTASLATLVQVELVRTQAIERVQLEVETAPPSTLERMQILVRSVASAMLGFCTGSVSRIIVETPLAAGAMTAFTNAASTTVNAVTQLLVCKPEEPDALFLMLEQSARAESIAFLELLRQLPSRFETEPDPVAVAKAFANAIGAVEKGVYQRQYEETLGAYYDLVAHGEQPLPAAVRGAPKDIADRHSASRGVLVVKGKADAARSVTVDYASFEGSKTEAHFEHVRSTPLGSLRVPVRLQLSATLGDETLDVTLYREASGVIRWTDEDTTVWLARQGTAVGRDAASEPSLVAAARSVFGRLDKEILGKKVSTTGRRIRANVSALLTPGPTAEVAP